MAIVDIGHPTPKRLTTRTSRSSLPIVALVVGFLLLATAKPWAGVGSPGPSVEPRETPPAIAGSSPSAPGTPPAASPTVAPEDPNATPCLSASGERLVTLVRTPDQEVRSWQLTTGAEGRDALQPGIVAVQIPAIHVVGIGICAYQPDQASEVRPAAEVLDVILVEPAGGGIEDLGQPSPITLDLDRQGARLYGAPASLRIGPDGSFVLPGPSNGMMLGPGPRLAAWAVGAYAMAFRYPADDPGVVRWIRFDIVAAPGIFG